jgi:hypothetical protein
MSREEIRKLLGGYTTGTLTPEERDALFEAALQDQELFEELAREQPLQELLSDSAARAQVLAALDERPVRWYRRWEIWSVTAAAAVAAVLAVGVIVKPKPTTVSMVAEVKAPVVAPMASAVEEDRPVAPAPARRAAPKRRAETAAAPPPPPPAVPEAALGAGRGGRGGLGGAVGGLQPTLQKAEEQVQEKAQLAQQQQVQVAPQQPQVPVMPSNQFVQNDNAGANLRLAPMMSVRPRVEITVLRKNEAGDFVVADPANLKTGDVVELRLETAQSGNLTVTEAGESNPIASLTMQAGVAQTTAPLRAGVERLVVTFGTQRIPIRLLYK